MLLLQSLLDHVGLMDYVGGCHCYFQLCSNIFYMRFPHSLFGSFKKKFFFLFISGCSGQTLTLPGSSLFVSVERQVAGHSALVWSDRFFFSNGAGRDHGLDRHNSDLVFLSSSHQ